MNEVKHALELALNESRISSAHIYRYRLYRIREGKRAVFPLVFTRGAQLRYCRAAAAAYVCRRVGLGTMSDPVCVSLGQADGV